MTKIKCPSESIFYVCRHLKNGYCTLDELEMEFELRGDWSPSHWIICPSEDLITNGMPEWKDFEQNRTEKYLPQSPTPKLEAEG